MDTNNSRPTMDKKYPDEGNISLYVGLISAALKDVAITCNLSDTELNRDWRETALRVKNEGMSFLTKTLPSLGKAVDLALSTDTILDVKGFKLAKGMKVPRFMRDVFLMVFDGDGCERSDASAQALKCIRQVTYLFYKLNLPHTPEQEYEVIQTFLKTDKDLAFNQDNLTPYTRWVLRYARNLICRILAPVDPLGEDSFFPRHGAGAVATGEKAWEKPIFKRFYTALNAVFPYDRHFFYNLTHLSDSLCQLEAMEVLEAGTAKVVLVPKDSRGPRLISCEPLEYQWIQQGLMRTMVKAIESHPLSKGMVNFTSQEVNRQLALAASLSGSQATLDMKEASDRVSLALVQALFPSTWFAALNACRSTHTRLPDGTIVELRKFAPMGSACCFPVEALIFWALSVSALAYYQDTPKGRKTVRKSVFVYGDDIICNTEDQGVLRRKLEFFDLKFNDSKCCTGKFFRESCGMDAYRGVDVTPLRIRAVWLPSLAGTCLASYVEYHNSFERRGMYNACDYLAEAIQQVRLTPYADSEGSEVIALVDSRKRAIVANKALGIQSRFSEKLHQYQVKAMVVRPRTFKSTRTPGWAEMLRIASLRRHNPEGAKEDDYRSRFRRALESLAPDGCRNSLRPTQLCVGMDGSEPPVKAYQYPLSRKVILKRDWGRLNIGQE